MSRSDGQNGLCKEAVDGIRKLGRAGMDADEISRLFRVRLKVVRMILKKTATEPKPPQERISRERRLNTRAVPHGYARCECGLLVKMPCRRCALEKMFQSGKLVRKYGFSGE